MFRDLFFGEGPMEIAFECALYRVTSRRNTERTILLNTLSPSSRDAVEGLSPRKDLRPKH